MTEDMVEAAARQICDQWGYIWDGDPDSDSQIAPDEYQPYDDRPSKALFRDAAREALRAAAPMIQAAAYERGQAEMRETAAKVADEHYNFAVGHAQVEAPECAESAAAAIRALPTGGVNG